MSWTVQWREENDYRVKTAKYDPEREPLTSFQRLMSHGAPTRAAEISFSRPAPTIQGEVPYADIVGSIKKGKVIPFLGAGVPLSSRSSDLIWDETQDLLPSGVELARHLAGRGGMPVWHLHDTENLARVASYFKVSNQLVTLGQVLSEIFTKGAPTDTHKLIAALTGKTGLQINVQPGQHQVGESSEKILKDLRIAKDAQNPLLIITTNYDLLMERALEGVEYDRVIHCSKLADKCSVLLWKSDWPAPKAVTEDQLRKNLDLTKRTVLYKMHGSIDTPTIVETLLENAENEHDSDATGMVQPDSTHAKKADTSQLDPRDNRFVITEENYVEFLARINADPPAVPNPFKEYFESRSFLFLGYSLDDWNLRVILHSLEDILVRNSVPESLPVVRTLAQLLGISPQRQHWAIQRDPTEYDYAVWRSRNVRIGNRNLNRFVEEIIDPIHGLAARA